MRFENRIQYLGQIRCGAVNIPGIINYIVGSLPFTVNRPLGLFAFLQFPLRPPPITDHSFGTQICGSINKNKPVTRVAPACFQQQSGIHNNDIHFMRCRIDSVLDCLVNRRVQDAFQGASIGFTASFRSEHQLCQPSAADLPLIIKDFVSEVSANFFSDRLIGKQLMTDLVCINDAEAQIFHMTDNRGFAGTDASKDANNRDGTGAR